MAPDFRARMVRVGERALSRGHAERFDAIVWANELAHAAWDDAVAPMPDGAMLVEEAVDRATPAPAGGAVERGERAAGLLVMEKSGLWRFDSVGPDGDVADEARVAPCAACHREAPRDGVFPVGPPAQPKMATSSAAITATAPTSVARAAATYDARSAGAADAPSSR